MSHRPPGTAISTRRKSTDRYIGYPFRRLIDPIQARPSISCLWCIDLLRDRSACDCRFPALHRVGRFAEEVLSEQHLSDSLAGKPWPTWVLNTRSLPSSGSSAGEPGSADSMVEMVAHMDRSTADERNSFWKDATKKI